MSTINNVAINVSLMSYQAPSSHIAAQVRNAFQKQCESGQFDAQAILRYAFDGPAPEASRPVRRSELAGRCQGDELASKIAAAAVAVDLADQYAARNAMALANPELKLAMKGDPHALEKLAATLAAAQAPEPSSSPSDSDTMQDASQAAAQSALTQGPQSTPLQSNAPTFKPYQRIDD